MYLHTPFCIHKCSYCDFYSFADSAPRFDVLADAVRHEILGVSGTFPKAVSVFFGGGTPSLLPLPALARIYAALRERLPWEDGAEITLEANPETVTVEWAKGLLATTPVNRVSLGAQSFSPENLAKLERLGSPESIRTAVGRLKEAGIPRFSLDLIFGIPGQGQEGMLRDIEEAVKLGPEHVSFYNLTLKPGHKLYGQLPDDDESAELFEIGCAKLAQEGYAQYEISNFARPGCESRHNLLYWSGGDFLGFGPSASSRLFRDGVFHHRKQVADLNRYLVCHDFDAVPFEPTTAAQTILEASFLELRKNAGVSVSEFAARYGYALDRASRFDAFVVGGLVEREGDRLRLTARGRLLADSVTRDLVD